MTVVAIEEGKRKLCDVGAQVLDTMWVDLTKL